MWGMLRKLNFGLILTLFNTLFLFGCATVEDTFELDSIHFPQVSNSLNSIALTGKITGTPFLIDNCIYLNKGKNKQVILWPSYTKLHQDGGNLIVGTDLPDSTNIPASKVVLGKKSTFVGGTTESSFVHSQSYMKPTKVMKCQSNGYVSVHKWEQL